MKALNVADFIGMKFGRLQVNANRLTDADVKNIKEAGLRVVCRPDPIKSNVVAIDDRRVMSAHTSPEVA
jgi:hypothetical protein